MEHKTSKAQIEVWEWKELLYEELKNIPEGKRIEYIQNKVKNTIENFLKKKQANLNPPSVAAEPKEKYGKR